jgi:heme/copper-type cytochrome/quinol oxidase subunit 1
MDWQVTDTYVIVAHIHYVFGGTMFAIFAGIYYWWPRMSGRMLSERLGTWHFWTTVVGFNLTFFVQHMLGIAGMTRRVWTYLPCLHPDDEYGALHLIRKVWQISPASDQRLGGLLMWIPGCSIYFIAILGVLALVRPTGHRYRTVTTDSKP